MGRQTISLSHRWHFALDEENIGLRDRWYTGGLLVKQVLQNTPHFAIFIRILFENLRFPDDFITKAACNLKIYGGIIPCPKQ
jgi:hypothetical protein